MAGQSMPEKYQDLLEKPAFAYVATLMPDGSPQVTPVWIDYNGTHVLVNTSRGRQKDRNLRRDPRVSVDILDPENPYRHLMIRGRVAEITADGADAHIDKMAKKYTGSDTYQNRVPGEVREIIKIEPERVKGYG
jgi:PPOX class probable F420-dependent enzyme